MKKSTMYLLYAAGALTSIVAVSVSNMELTLKIGVCLWLIGAAIHFIIELIKESAE